MNVSTYVALIAALVGSSTQLPSLKIQSLRQCVMDAGKSDRFSGIVAVARKGRLLSSISHGHAQLNGTDRITAETRFNIASVGKMFTAVAIGQLVQSGRLRFDQPIGSVLPGLPNDIAQVTIDQLLTHRSGLGDYLKPQNRVTIYSATTATDLLPIAISDGLAFPPGTEQRYSNSGFVVLGAVIEKLTGQPYAQYIRAHIFEPAGMRTADLSGAMPRATPLTKRNLDGTTSEIPRPAPVIGGDRASPAGGASASVLDMVKFAEALRTGKLVPLSILNELWRGRVQGKSSDGKLSYGYGFARMDFPDGRWLVGHNGGSLGVNAEFETFPDEGYTIVALSNYDPPAATQAIAMARRAVLGQSPCASGKSS
jgi:CubicO group peptidase (beta-lactamase class C family)